MVECRFVAPRVTRSGTAPRGRDRNPMRSLVCAKARPLHRGLLAFTNRPRAGWQNPTWTSLNFSVDDPFYYQYAYNSGGTEGTSTFRAGAYGDLDRNNIFSTYERAGSVDAQLNVTGGAGLYVVNDIE